MRTSFNLNSVLDEPDEFQDFSEGKKKQQSGLQAEADLKQFLKVVRPDWSLVRSGKGDQLQHVVDKLRAIGVTDTQTFVDRVFEGSINTDLFGIGRTRFSQSTLETVKRHRPLMQALDNASNGPYLRQTGRLNPMSGLLSKNAQSALGLQTAGALRPRTVTGAAAPQVLVPGASSSSLISGSGPSTPVRLRGPPKDKRFNPGCSLPQAPPEPRPETPVAAPEKPEAASSKKVVGFQGPDEEEKKSSEPPPPPWSSMKTEVRVPGWQEDVQALSLTHGEEMLKEQAIIDDLKVLLRLVHKNNPGLRAHVIGNVKSRMRREKEKVAADSIGMDQHLYAVRNNIEKLAKSRRELSGIRSQWHFTLKRENPQPDPPPVCLDFMKSAMAGKKEEEKRKRAMSLAMRNSIIAEMDDIETLNADLQCKARASLLREHTAVKKRLSSLEAKRPSTVPH